MTVLGHIQDLPAFVLFLLAVLVVCSSVQNAFVKAQQQPQQQRCTTSSHDVIVIGAGIAGIRAAARINEITGVNNRLNVAVLESTNRIGGRVRTHKGFGENGDLTIEDGANWLYNPSNGGPQNEIYKMAQRYQLANRMENVRTIHKSHRVSIDWMLCHRPMRTFRVASRT